MSQTKLNHAIANELDRAVESISQVILGKDQQIRLALACLVAKGHLLIEDMPGSGKTTLAHVIAQVMGLDFHRIQFTSDLLPTDVLGLSVYNRDRNNFEFHPGPIFSNLVLADEVNRATPKTQSALLEAMEEHQVTVEGETRPLIFIPRLKVMVMVMAKNTSGAALIKKIRLRLFTRWSVDLRAPRISMAQLNNSVPMR